MIDKKLAYILIIVAVGFGAFQIGFYVGADSVLCPICPPSQVDLSLLWETYDKLKENYIDAEKITEQELIYGAVSGMVKSLGDPNTSFFNPEDAKIFQQDLSGSFEGVGMEIGIRRNQLTVIAPLNGTPAERAGLKAGDLIVKIDGKDTFDILLEEAVRLIRGEKGTEVVLSIYRDDWQETRDISIIRDTIRIQSMEWEFLENNIAYVKINHFDQTLNAEFRKAAFDIISGSADKIILDLRNNPGGFLDTSVYVAGWFLPKGEVVTIEDFGGKKESVNYVSQGNAALGNYPIVVLINGGSASASEILAGALRDHKNTQLVGEKSFGKGTVQEIVPLRDGKSILKVTVAKWLTPNGVSISDEGLEPDVKVELTAGDIDNNTDPQLDKAIEIISNLD